MQTAHENLLADLRLSLRPGRRQDGESLHVLIGGILESYGLEAEGIAKDGDLNDVTAWYGSRNGMFDVLEDSSGALVGCCGVFARSESVCELRRLYLAYKVRRRGLGKVLMDYILGWARARGFVSMELFTSPMLREAVALYEKYGFVRVTDSPGKDVSGCDLHFNLRLSDSKSKPAIG